MRTRQLRTRQTRTDNPAMTQMRTGQTRTPIVAHTDNGAHRQMRTPTIAHSDKCERLYKRTPTKAQTDNEAIIKTKKNMFKYNLVQIVFSTRKEGKVWRKKGTK